MYCYGMLAEDDRLEELNGKTLAWWNKMGRDTRPNDEIYLLFTE